jgi:hypothetical protein
VSKKFNLFRALLHFPGLALALCLAAAPALAETYRWVDETGKVHYGDRPPQGKQAREVSNKLSSPTSGGQAGPDWQEQDRGFRQRQLSAESDAAEKAEAAERRVAQCKEQWDLLTRLKESGRTYRIDEKGERAYLSDAERESAIARQEKIATQACSR